MAKARVVHRSPLSLSLFIVAPLFLYPSYLYLSTYPPLPLSLTYLSGPSHFERSRTSLYHPLSYPCNLPDLIVSSLSLLIPFSYLGCTTVKTWAKPVSTTRRSTSSKKPPLKGASGEQIAKSAVALVHKLFETAAAVVTRSVCRRNNPLFALSLYGAGKTELSDQIKKESLFIEAMLPIMYHAADTYAIDVALCTTSTSAYKVMQFRRVSLCPFADGPF